MKIDPRFDFQEEELILIEKATKRKEEEIVKRINKEKAYAQRKDILQQYFIRMSTVNKEKLIRRLLDNLTHADKVLEVAHFMCIGDAKPFVYTSVYHQTDFAQDKFLIDHNRSLDEKVLQEAIENDIQWFKQLNSDQQVDVIISVLRESGGYIQKNLFFPIFKRCFLQRGSRCSEESAKDIDIEKPKLLLDESEDPLYLLNHPATTEVENQRKNWNNIISKYREKVESVMKANLQKENDGKDKSKDESKKVKSEKDTKGSSGKRESKIDVHAGGTDWIQLLPIWSVKKIFSYFDENTLKKLYKVNAYWAYAAQEVLSERKLRVQLNKEIEKAKAELGPRALEDKVKPEDSPKRRILRRLNPNFELGANVEALRPKQTDCLVQTSLMSETMKMVTADYFYENILSFLREVGDETPIYRYQPCPLKDVNVVLGVREDLKQAESFLTYSLSTKSSSLSLTVDRQTLEEW